MSGLSLRRAELLPLPCSRNAGQETDSIVTSCKSVHLIAAARPTFMKVAPLSRPEQIRAQIVHTSTTTRTCRRPSSRTSAGPRPATT